MNRTKRTSERMFSFFVGRRDIRTATGALRPGNDMVNKKRRVRRDTWVPPCNRAFLQGRARVPCRCGGAGDREGRPYAKIYIGSSHTKVSLDSRGKK